MLFYQPDDPELKKRAIYIGVCPYQIPERLEQMTYALTFCPSNAYRQKFGVDMNSPNEYLSMQPTPFGQVCSKGDKVGVQIEFKAEERKIKISFFKNGINLDKKGGPCYSSSMSGGYGTLHPFIAMLNGSGVTLNPNAQSPNDLAKIENKALDKKLTSK